MKRMLLMLAAGFLMLFAALAPARGQVSGEPNWIRVGKHWAHPTELLARLDDGGLSVHYVHGTGLAPSPEMRALVDAARRALRR